MGSNVHRTSQCSSQHELFGEEGQHVGTRRVDKVHKCTNTTRFTKILLLHCDDKCKWHKTSILRKGLFWRWLLNMIGSSSGGSQDVTRSPLGDVGMNDFELLKVLGTGGDLPLLLTYQLFGGLLLSHMQMWMKNCAHPSLYALKKIMLIFAANGKVFLVRKIRGPDRGHLYAMKVSI